MSRRVLVGIAAAGMAAALLVGGSAIAGAGPNQPEPPSPGTDMEQMHERMIQEHPGMAEMHEQMIQEHPGMAEMHEQMIQEYPGMAEMHEQMIQEYPGMAEMHEQMSGE